MKPPKKVKNSARRVREHLTPTEIDKLITAARHLGRHGLRDATMILIAHQHGLRVSELVSLRWSHVDLKQGLLYVVRRKNGLSTNHPLFGPKLRALRQLKREYPDTDYIFMTERHAPITADTFQKIIARAGNKAKLGLSVHPHMLRHSTGFKLANDGQDTRSIQHYLGHKNIQHTVRYTEIAAVRFKRFWDN